MIPINNIMVIIFLRLFLKIINEKIINKIINIIKYNNISTLKFKVVFDIIRIEIVWKHKITKFINDNNTKILFTDSIILNENFFIILY